MFLTRDQNSHGFGEIYLQSSSPSKGANSLLDEAKILSSQFDKQNYVITEN